MPTDSEKSSRNNDKKPFSKTPDGRFIFCYEASEPVREMLLAAFKHENIEAGGTANDPKVTQKYVLEKYLRRGLMPVFKKAITT
jgi:hypothetical protein